MSKIILVPCSHKDCPNDAVGMCNECRGMYCTDHLLFNGTDPDTMNPLLICKDDRANAVRRKIFQPLPNEMLPTEKLRKLVIDYVEIRAGEEYIGDLQHYIFEEAIKMVYGDDIWPKLNKLPEH